MRIVLLAVGLSWLLTAPLPAQQPQQPQQQETLWQRFKGVFTRQTNNNAPKTETRPLGSDSKRNAADGPRETRGVVYVDDQKPAQNSKTPLRPVPLNAAPTKQASEQPTPRKQTPAVAPPAKAAMPASKTDTLAQSLTRQVAEKCPQAKNVKVAFTAEREITVEMEVRTQEEANAMVEQVFGIRDLDAYRVNVKFNVPQP